MQESYIRQIFEGKKTFDLKGLKELNKKISSMGLIENQFNEAKVLNNQDKLTSNDKLYEENLIRPLIAFLNSFDGFGYLYLGVRSSQGNPKFLNVQPIKEEIIKNEEHLRILMTGKIGTIPRHSDFPRIEIERINFPSGNVFIVKASRTNNFLAYYSKITDKIYKRHADESTPLDLFGATQFIGMKKSPRISLKCTFLRNNPEDKNKLIYDLHLVNDGLEPSESITGLISVLPGIGIEYLPKISFPSSFVLRTDANAILPLYQFNCAHPSHDMPVYPGVPTRLGELILEVNHGSSFNLKFQIKIMDKKSVTNQSFSIKDIFKTGVSIPNFNPVDEKIEYSPYV